MQKRRLNQKSVLSVALACFSAMAFSTETGKPVDVLCTVEVAKLTAKAKAVLKAGNPDKAFQMLYDCGTNLTDAEALKIKGQARVAGLKKAELNDPTSVAKLKRLRKKEGVSVGMSQFEVIESSWGKPLKINRTTTATSHREQWIYRGGYLYFNDGILTTIQN